jgi:predicted ATPase
VLLVATLRPELQQPWTGQPHLTMMSLARLDRDDTGAIVASIAGINPTSPIGRLFEHTQT